MKRRLMLEWKLKNGYPLVLLFALASAILYSCLLPLWEGFDEPFHYGYIQSLSLHHRFARLHETRISAEIRQSLTLAPVSPILHRSLPKSISFPDWFRLSPEQRLLRKQALSTLPPELKNEPSELGNHEAQQAPLAYVLLAPFNLLVSSLPLTHRILVLRLFLAVLSTVLLFLASNLLAKGLGLEQPFRVLALACIFESQMLWASIAHVGNDWLSVSLAIALLAYLALLARYHRPTNAMLAGILLAAGLLTKAYFLAFAPVFLALLLYEKLRSCIALRTMLLALCAPVVIAGPWYIRNFLLYQSFSGMQEAARGIGLQQTIHAFFQINWPRSFVGLARWSLWTGNWSFVAFSRSTLNFELLLLAASFILLLIRYKQITSGELWIFAALACFACGLVFYTCMAWVDTKGVATSAMPWYPQCIMPAIWILAILGMQRSGLAGRVIAGVTCLVAAWIAALTYLAKLFPLYGGFEGRASLPALWKWWSDNPGALLSSVTLVPVSVLFGLLVTFLLLLIALNAAALKNLASPFRGSACECARLL
jgi:hypothetical protein